MEFRLLGPVEVVDGERVVDVGAARQRCVLAVLLFEANRYVSTEQLVDRVWGGGRPPDRPRNAVQMYVSLLRRALSGVEDLAIARRSSAYALTVDEGSVDVHRFRRLVELARRAATDDRAATLLEEALGLWRGEFCATLDNPWLDGVRESLDKERRAAQLDYQDVQLRRGRHAELLATLSQQVGEYPLDERLAAQYLLALYRDGRQAEALRHFWLVKSNLAEELGVDPGHELRRLYEQILAADSTLDNGAVPTRPTPITVPYQLPLDHPGFTGRLHHLASLDRLLPEVIPIVPARASVCVISGAAGVGKTTLAVHWGHRVADRFPDGQLYVNLRGFGPDGGALAPGEAIRGFLTALGVPANSVPHDLAAQGALYRSLMTGRRMLVLLDNARDADQVRPLLPAAPGCRAVVTSRNQLSGLIALEGALPVPLGLLTLDEARALLTLRLGAERVLTALPAAEEIIASCACLPLALAIVAARAALNPHFPLDAIAAELRDDRDRLHALTGDDPASDVRRVFSWSYHALSDRAARLFQLFGLHKGPDISVTAAASLAGIPRAEARRALDELTRAHLLTEHVPDRHTCHDLLRAYAADLAEDLGEAERREAVHRVLDHYLHTAYAAALLVSPALTPLETPPAPPRDGALVEPPADYAQAQGLLMVELEVLLAAVDRAAADGFDGHAWRLAWALSVLLDRQGRWRDRVAVHSTALAAAERLGDRAGQALMERGLANTYARMGRYDEARAHLERALESLAGLGDRAGQANGHLNLAFIVRNLGDKPAALEHTEAALGLYTEIGNAAGRGRAMHEVGWHHAQEGEYQRAYTYCTESLELLRAVGDRYGQAGAWDSLGYIHHHLGEHGRAVECFARSLALLDEIDDRPHSGEVLVRLGDAHLATGDTRAAWQAWHRALAILDDIGHPDAAQLQEKLAALDYSPTGV